MAKYIDADRLIRRLENRTYRAKGKFIEMINEQEAADVVEVRHGHWRILYEANPYDLEAECSVCHNEVKMPTCMGKPIYSYCPHCAAKMDEVTE